MSYSPEVTDALTEVVNIGVGRAAASLNELIGERIELSVPQVTFCALSAIQGNEQLHGADLDTSIIQDFEGPTSGRAVLAFPGSSAMKLGQILAGLDETPTELDFDLRDVLNEVGNIVLNGVLGSLSNILQGHLQYTVPQLSTETSLRQLVDRHMRRDSSGDATVLIADARFNVAARNICGSLILLFDCGGINAITDVLLQDETVS